MVPVMDPNDTEAGIKVLEELTTDAKKIQEQVLEEILKRNAGTEYHRRFMDAESNRQAFKEKVPVVTYEDMKPYFSRICNGEPSEILSGQPLAGFCVSSGTSGGVPKMMPFISEDLDRLDFFFNLRMHVLNKNIGGVDKGRGLIFLFTDAETITPSGLVARVVTNHYYMSNHFRNRPRNWYFSYVNPDETILCTDIKQSMYCQLLSGLALRLQVTRVGSIFASVFLSAIKFLENHWQEMCSNLKTGHLSDWITDTNCKNALSDVLKGPNPELAETIASICGRTSWENIIRAIWPNALFVEGIVSGSMAQYIPMLEFYSGGLPMVTTTYASSESYSGINLDPLCKPEDIAYTFVPNMAFFEFIPLNDGNDESCEDDEIVDLVDVKAGRCYEIVITTFNGLNRFRVGDVLKVIGFHNKSPTFRFVQRRNVVLSVDTEKTTEEDLIKGVNRAKLELETRGFLLTDYTFYADTSSIPGHYVLFWEIKNGTSSIVPDVSQDQCLMEECCFLVEDSLDSVYKVYRSSAYETIGPLEIRLVKPGSFDSLMEMLVSQGSSVNQYKTPRCIKSDKALNVLDSRVVARFFSRKTIS